MSSKRVIANLELEVEGTIDDKVEKPEELIAGTVRDCLDIGSGLRVNGCDLLPDINTGDLKLKHLKHALSTCGEIRIKFDTGECFSPSIGTFEQYYDYYVTNIFAHNDVLYICVKSEI